MTPDHNHYIAVEGIDGAGKSTQLSYITTYLRDQGFSVCLTREPGGTPLGEVFRRLIFEGVRGHIPGPYTETLLYVADRIEHLRRVVFSALESGSWVLSDRCLFSTLAYQGYARGLGIDRLIEIHKAVDAWVLPDLTLYFDVEPSVSLQRKEQTNEITRFEREGLEFMVRVREGYQVLLERLSQYIVRVDAKGSSEEVFERVRTVLVRKFPCCLNEEGGA